MFVCWNRNFIKDSSIWIKSLCNISGESTNEDKTDIVIIKSISENVQAYRSSWRDNY
jgi:hypothetical protein